MSDDINKQKSKCLVNGKKFFFVVNHCEMEICSHEQHRFFFWQTNTTLLEISGKIKDHIQNINPSSHFS